MDLPVLFLVWAVCHCQLPAVGETRPLIWKYPPEVALCELRACCDAGAAAGGATAARQRDQAQFWVVLFTCKRQEFRVSRLAIRGGLIDQTFGCKLAASAAHIDGVFVPEERIQLLVGEIPFRPLIAASFRSGRQRDGHKGARQGCQGGSGHLLGHLVPSLVFLTQKESGRK